MDVSFQVTPFAFDRIFVDHPAVVDPAARAAALELRVVALTAELTAAREGCEAMVALARADAFADGLAQARGETEAATLNAADALQASLEVLDTRLDDTVAAMRRDAAEVALAAAEFLAARALDDAPAAAIDAAIGRALDQVARGQELVVRVHSAQVAEVERLLAVRQRRDRRRLKVRIIAGETLAPGDANVEWDAGGLTLDAAARARAVRDELQTLLTPA